MKACLFAAVIACAALPLQIKSQTVMYPSSQMRDANSSASYPNSRSPFSSSASQGEEPPKQAKEPATPYLPPEPSQESLIKSALEEMLGDLRVSDASKAYYESFTADFRKEVSLSDFKSFVKSTPVFAKNKSLTLESLSFNGIVANARGKLVSTAGQVLRAQFDLVQENGQWKIRKIDLFRPDLNSP